MTAPPGPRIEGPRPTILVVDTKVRDVLANGKASVVRGGTPRAPLLTGSDVSPEGHGEDERDRGQPPIAPTRLGVNVFYSSRGDVAPSGARRSRASRARPGAGICQASGPLIHNSA